VSDDDNNGSGSPRRSALLTALAPLSKQWAGMAWREKQLVWAAGLLIAGTLVWLVGLQPALRTLRDTPAQIDALELQLQQMRRLSAEAQALRGAAPVSVAQASLSLKAATDRLGPAAKLVLQGDRATLSVTDTPSEALQAWLGEARSAARARPVEATLSRGAKGYTGNLVLAIGGTP
jgi:general secretion pathway protein M